MFDLFTEENYYWCSHCENYSMEIIYIRDENRIYECVLCGEQDDETLD